MRREKLGKYLVTTRMIEGKRSTGKQREKMLGGLTKWPKVRRVREALKVKVTRDRAAWKDMIAYS